MTSTAEVSEPDVSKNASDVMIEARGLSKFYGDFAATRDVSFTVPQGQVCAFLGPNGAGKSTTMKLLTGFLSPSQGESFLAGFNVATDRIKASEKLGYLPENGPLYTEMTPEGMLKYIGEVRGVTGGVLRDRMTWVADKCSLKEVWRKPIAKLSRGFRQRVGMANAMLHDPAVLILDEPTSGLHPSDIVHLTVLLRGLVNAGHSVIVIEHNTELVNSSDWVIDVGPDSGPAGGQIVATGRPSDIIAAELSITGRFL